MKANILDQLNHLKKRKPAIINLEEYLVTAVLIPLVELDDGLHVIFEVRAGHLNRQPSEICLPGGKVEKNELSNPEITAVRETTEELGLCRKDVEVISPVDWLVTPFGAIVYPYVGRVVNPQEIKPSPSEVQEVFTVPLDFFLNHEPMNTHAKVAVKYAKDFPFERVPKIYKKGWQERWSYPVYFYQYGERTIWGLTSLIIYNFVKFLK